MNMPCIEILRGARAPRPSLLLIDPSKRFCAGLSAAFEERGFEVIACHSAQQALGTIDSQPPGYIATQLRLPDLSGLALIARLKERAPVTIIVVLTGHGSIATAVEAIKPGATHYLVKPATAAQVTSAFTCGNGNANHALNDKPLSLTRLEWEYVNQVLSQHGGNISATAKVLSMHRRTLQRKLTKRVTAG